MKYVYREGVVLRSKRNPGVISGELPRSQPTIIREAWVPWRYWLWIWLKTVFHALMRRVPPLRERISRVWCESWEYRWFGPFDRETIHLSWAQTTPENRARHQELVDDRSQAPRSPNP